MHKKIIEHASDEQLKNFIYDYIGMLKGTNPELYEEAECLLYCTVYGDHFNDWSLKCATDCMVNEDGTTGAHWSVDDTNSIAKQHNIQLSKYNEYDWNYVMNMVYSDYYGVIDNNTDSYCRVAKKFLLDKDAPLGKAYKYYIAMK